MNDEAVTFVRKVKKVLSKPGAWTQGTYARNKMGDSVDLISEDAVSWCLLGAMESLKIDGLEEDSTAHKLIYDIMRTILGRTVSDFNDDPETTIKEVIEVLDETENVLGNEESF